jgi:hypothetical protein
MPNIKNPWLSAPILLILASGTVRAADTQHELLVFGSAEIARARDIDLDETHIDAEKVAADILFSLQRDSFRVFGEYLLTNHESDLERFQVGWEPSERSIVWIGRFHQASSVWNHEHHHGQFLQTSITRPASEEWEDEGGIIPQHFVGALWESSWPAGLHAAFGGGIAPTLTGEGLEAFDLFKLNMARHKFGAQARIAWLPDELEETGLGLLYAHNEIGWHGPTPSSPRPFDHVDQNVVGAYARYDENRWKLQAAAYRVTTFFDGFNVDATHQTFVVAYAQVERDFSSSLAVYLRHENTADPDDSSYLRLFPEFVNRRSTVGTRWQFARSHAVTFEVSEARQRSHDYKEVRLQWSAALL